MGLLLYLNLIFEVRHSLLLVIPTLVGIAGEEKVILPIHKKAVNSLRPVDQVFESRRPFIVAPHRLIIGMIGAKAESGGGQHGQYQHYGR